MWIIGDLGEDLRANGYMQKDIVDTCSDKYIRTIKCIIQILTSLFQSSDVSFVGITICQNTSLL